MAAMLGLVPVRQYSVRKKLQDYALSLSESFSPLSDEELDEVVNVTK